MDKTIEAFKNADTIRFTSIITNEEALILQKLKEKYGLKLVNDEAYRYKKFLESFSLTSGKKLYSGNARDIENSDYVVVFGTRISQDIPGLKFKVNQASKKQKAQVIYLHPIEDDSIKNIVTQYMKYEVGSEEGVLSIIAKELIENEKLPKKLQNFFDYIDDGYISAESNIGEEEIELMMKKMYKKHKFSFIVGSDLYAHPQAENIAKMLGLIERNTDFDVVIIPPSVNTLGVSLICDLDESAGSSVIGYNDIGDFVLSSLEDKGDVNLPAINQQEGTFTNINKQVVQTNVAMGFDGFCLNDIANKLGLDNRYTIDYTSELSQIDGYKSVKFDDLQNHFDANGVEHRGYELENLKSKIDNSLSEIEDIPTYDGVVLYTCNPNSQKNVFTNICKYLETDVNIVGSKQFAIAAKINDGDEIKVNVNGVKIQKGFKIDPNLKGTIGLLSNFDLGFEGQSLMSDYRFNKVKIEQVGK